MILCLKEAYSVGTGADTERHERKVMPDATEG